MFGINIFIQVFMRAAPKLCIQMSRKGISNNNLYALLGRYSVMTWKPSNGKDSEFSAM